MALTHSAQCVACTSYYSSIQENDLIFVYFPT
jgi:hypothetical protein